MATVTFDHSYSTIPKTVTEFDEPIGVLTLSRGDAVPFDIDYQSFLHKWVRGEANASRHAIYKTADYVSTILGLITFLLFFIIRQFFLSHLKRKTITKKLVRIIDQKMNEASH